MSFRKITAAALLILAIPTGAGRGFSSASATATSAKELLPPDFAIADADLRRLLTANWLRVPTQNAGALSLPPWWNVVVKDEDAERSPGSDAMFYVQQVLHARSNEISQNFGAELQIFSIWRADRNGKVLPLPDDVQEEMSGNFVARLIDARYGNVAYRAEDVLRTELDDLSVVTYGTSPPPDSIQKTDSKTAQKISEPRTLCYKCAALFYGDKQVLVMMKYFSDQEQYWQGELEMLLDTWVASLALTPRSLSGVAQALALPEFPPEALPEIVPLPPRLKILPDASAAEEPEAQGEKNQEGLPAIPSSPPVPAEPPPDPFEENPENLFEENFFLSKTVLLFSGAALFSVAALPGLIALRRRRAKRLSSERNAGALSLSEASEGIPRETEAGINADIDIIDINEEMGEDERKFIEAPFLPLDDSPAPEEFFLSFPPSPPSEISQEVLEEVSSEKISDEEISEEAPEENFQPEQRERREERERRSDGSGEMDFDKVHALINEALFNIDSRLAATSAVFAPSRRMMPNLKETTEVLDALEKTFGASRLMDSLKDGVFRTLELSAGTPALQTKETVMERFILKLCCDILLGMLWTGRYHVGRGILSCEGQELLDLFHRVNGLRAQKSYSTPEEAEKDAASIQRCLGELG